MINIQFYHRRSKVLKSATFHRCLVKLGYQLGRALKNPTKIVHFTSGRRRGGGFFAERFFPWSLFPKSLDSSETVRSRAKPDCCEEITYPSLPLTSSIQRQYQTQKINFTFTLHLLYRENIIKHHLPTEACLNLCDTAVFWISWWSFTPTPFWQCLGSIFLLLQFEILRLQVKIVNRSRLHQVPCWLKLITELQQRAQRRKSKMARQVMNLKY